MSDFTFSRDDYSAPRAEAKNPALAELAKFLESDIQDDTQTCGDLLEEIFTLGDNDEPIEFIGNSYILSYDHKYAALGCHAIENAKPVPIRSEAVVTALREWLEFLH